MKLLLSLAAVMVCAGLSACDRPSPDQAAAESPSRCRRDGSNPEIKACASDDMAKERARMQRYIDAAMVRARKDDESSVEYGPRSRQAAYLEESQRAWEGYVKSRCDGVFEATNGGTMGGLGYMGCMASTTRQRTHDIWDDYLTYWDSTPPVLPEPLLTVAEEEIQAASQKETPRK